MINLSKSILGIVCALSIGSASAVDVGHGFDISANANLANNYVWRGDTQTDDELAFSGGFDISHESGLYLGNWNSNVSFGDDTTLESDVYGGFAYEFESIGLGVDVGAIGYFYPGSDGDDDLDFYEVYGGLSGTLGPVSLGPTFYYDPDNENSYIVGAVETTFDIVTLGAHVGRTVPDEGENLTDWGVTASVNVVTLDWGVAYTDKEDGDSNVIFSVGKSF